MGFKFDNYARQVGSRGQYSWYEWMVFMDEPLANLERVKSVEYRLHSTFANPIRLVDDRDSGFALKSEGWGEFRIFITIYRTDDQEEQTHYDLDLGKAWRS
jgi:transcription initiation factor IIF auxiliary subunit